MQLLLSIEKSFWEKLFPEDPISRRTKEPTDEKDSAYGCAWGGCGRDGRHCSADRSRTIGYAADLEHEPSHGEHEPANRQREAADWECEPADGSGGAEHAGGCAGH
jgi:hypothetical protein